MPFTPNRAFKKAPRLIARAKDMHYYTARRPRRARRHGRPVVLQRRPQPRPDRRGDPAPGGRARLSRRRSSSRIRKAFELASRIAALAPGDLDHVFFCNSGSEAVDTALKIALAYTTCAAKALAHAPDRARARLSRRRLRRHLGRRHRRQPQDSSAPLLAGVDHLPHTYNREQQAFTKGEPEWGAHLADELERIVALHDASTIAAVIVEPMAGSTGVLPPPKGYLQRLRAICDKHGILLIFDEVITGFGRLGIAVRGRALRRRARHDHVRQGRDLRHRADGRRADRASGIYDAFMRGPEHVIELFHGYTYSAHPLACAAGLATLDLYRDEELFERAASLEPNGPMPRCRSRAAQRARHPHRRPRRRHRARLQARRLGKRAYDAMEKAFHEQAS